MNDERWTMNGKHYAESEFEEYLREAEGLGAQLIAFGRKVRKQGIRL